MAVSGAVPGALGLGRAQTWVPPAAPSANGASVPASPDGGKASPGVGQTPAGSSVLGLIYSFRDGGAS